MADLRRTLNFRTTIAIVVGGVIGSGIFMKPSLMAAQLGSPLLLLSVWIVAGCITLFGALSNAEVAAMFPETGGQYIFFKKCTVMHLHLCIGWAAFAVFNTGGNASIAYVCSQYADYFVHLPRFDAQTEHAVFFHLPFIGNIYPLENAGVKSLTIAIIVLLSGVNYYSVQYGGALQRFLTVLKAVADSVANCRNSFFRHGRSAKCFSQCSIKAGEWSIDRRLCCCDRRCILGV
jgi:APA family basic amino acid/polyamine antiporter